MNQNLIFKLWLGLILIVAGFTRFYNLSDSLQFQGDQGRDAIIVSQIFTKLDPVFIGPVTSVGNMYLGPFYYYFMLPFLVLSYPNPIGPVYGVGILSILTSYLIYKWGKDMVGELAALFGASLYTLSATAMLYARFSWNPNLAPFVSLVVVYYVWKAITQSAKNWWVVGLGISILLQLHYVTLLAAVAAGIVWFWQVISGLLITKSNHQSLVIWFKKSRPLWQGTGLAIGIFLASLTPLFLFDWKHNWLNSKAFQALIFKDKTFESQIAIGPVARIGEILKETDGRSMHILAEINLGKQRPLNRTVVILTLLGLILAIIQAKKSNQKTGLIILSLFLGVGILGTAVYQHTVFDHYIAYLFPISALVSGVALAQLTKLNFLKLKLGWGLVLICLGYFLSYNLKILPIKSTGWTINQIKMTSQTILDRVKPGEKYNIVLISESHDLDGQNYRYFLTTNKAKAPVRLEDRDSSETLFIINEEKKTRDVTGLPMYEIVVFPNKTPSEVYQVPGGPEITVLRRYTQIQN